MNKASKLWDGSLLVEMRSDDQCTKLFKQKLLCSYLAFVEKHKILNSTTDVIFCSQLDGCICEVVQAGLADEYVSKEYRVQKE